jgi:hypothetical protein
VCSKAFNEAGIPMIVGPHTQEFIMSWLKTLRDAKESVVETVPFGWIAEKGVIVGFAYAGKVFTKIGSRAAAQPDPVLRAQYTPRGERAFWLSTAQLINHQGRPDLDCILATAFAAPLIRSTGREGCVLGGFSLESGIGKTTTLRIAQAVWGDPARGMQGLDDTTNSVVGKLEKLASLPVYYDELKTAKDTETFVNMVFKMSGGKGRSRMRANASLREVGVWNTLLTYASNESLRDFVISGTRTTPAGILRLFEFRVAPSPIAQSDNATVSRLVARLNENFGHAGLSYAEFLGTNYEAVDKMVNLALMGIEKDWHCTTEERYWSATVAALLVGAKLANHLQLTAFDIPAMKAFLKQELLRMRGEKATAPNDMSQSLNVITLLGSYLAEKRAQHTLITNRTWVSRGKPPKNHITIKNDATRLLTLEVQLSIEDKVLRFTSTSIGDWLKAKSIPRYTFMEALKDQLAASPVIGRMGSGTGVASPTEQLFQISFAGHELEDHLELDNLR